MSFVNSILNPSRGAGYQANTNTAAINAANSQVQNDITQQQNFVNALNAQNGLQNQSAVFGQQQALSGQLQNIANGQGPNPAQAALQQATGQNIASQAALMAGQRGSSSNAGLLARQAAQQGAATQQQAVGQGATMQAQQSLGALQQLQSQQANMANLANTQVNQQQTGLSALQQAGLQNQSNVMGLQQSANSANAQIAAVNAQGQQGIIGGVLGGVGSALGLAEGGMIPDIGSEVKTVLPLIAAAAAEGGEARQRYDSGGPVYDSANAAAASLQPAMPSQYISGQMSPQLTGTQDSQPTTASSPQSKAAQFMKGMGSGISSGGKSGGNSETNPIAQGLTNLGAGIGKMYRSSPSTAQQQVQGQNEVTGAANVGSGNDDYYSADNPTTPGGDTTAYAGSDSAATDPNLTARGGLIKNGKVQLAKGGKVPALVSPGEIRIPRKDVKKVVEGKKSPLDGEKIPGKPKVPGAVNSYANDTIPKTLNEGDIILPRSVTQSKHPQWAAHKFVAEIMAQKHRGKK